MKFLSFVDQQRGSFNSVVFNLRENYSEDLKNRRPLKKLYYCLQLGDFASTRKSWRIKVLQRGTVRVDLQCGKKKYRAGSIEGI